MILLVVPFLKGSQINRIILVFLICVCSCWCGSKPSAKEHCFFSVASFAQIIVKAGKRSD